MSLQEDVIDLIAEQLGLDKEEITETSSIVDDLGADSLDLTELIMSLESDFECEISEEEAQQLRTVAQICDYIEKKRALS